MKRAGSAFVVGLGVQALLYSVATGHLGPWGLTDPLGMCVIALELPGIWAADLSRAIGWLELAVMFTAPIPVYAGLIWLIMAGAGWLMEWRASL